MLFDLASPSRLWYSSSGKYKKTSSHMAVDVVMLKIVLGRLSALAYQSPVT